MDTYSHHEVDLFEFNDSMVPPIEDIARGLAHECRFHGQCRHHYSVAQHSILVFELCGTMQGLMHDCEEGLFKDFERAMKRHPLMGPYRSATERARMIILRHFGINPVLSQEVHEADRAALYIEIANITNRNGKSSVKLPQWTPDHAYDMFLKAYHSVMEGDEWHGVLIPGCCISTGTFSVPLTRRPLDSNLEFTI